MVDLPAFDRNLDRLCAPLERSGRTLRVASKSLRVPALIQRVLERPCAQGVLTYQAAETALLAKLGIDDLLLAYPPSPHDLSVLVGLPAKITVDALPVVTALSKLAVERQTTVELCIDVDLSLHLGPVHLGVRRSPIRSAAQAVALARAIEDLPNVELTALLAYEAQIAGVPDRTGGLVDHAVALVKRRSRRLALERRANIVAALRQHADLTVVNGGGTGSIDFTAEDPSVTEVSAGSGLFCPHLFDGYDGLDLEPAAFFALSVVRNSDPGFFTCYGGGFAASGAAGPDRLPRPWWPEGLQILDMEGFGEVQTPMKGELPWGATVLCRHAKAGELMEHFETVHVLEQGERTELPTYRGSESQSA